MLDQNDIQSKVLIVRREIQARLGVQGRDLGHALRRSGRRLPARVRKHGAALAEAEFLARNPKMARRLDGDRVQAAFDEVITHLRGIDRGEERKGQLLGLAGTIAANLLLVVVAFIFFLWWRGYV